jgi:hypothetical protein
MRKATTTLAVTLLAVLSVLGAVQATYANDMLIRVYFDNFEHLKKVVSQFEDVASWGGRRYADISVPQERFAEIEALAPNYEVLIPDIQREIADLGILGVGSAYHTYEEAYAEMDSVADANPTICVVQSLGQSLEGRQIWAIKISDNVGTTEDEPRVLYMGNHHAREYVTVEIPLYLMYYFVDNYGSDPRVTNLVNNREIWIVPIVNPDGREYCQNYNSNWRKNRRPNGDGSYGVDINRNYGYMWGYDNEGSSPTPSAEDYRGTAAFSEPETQRIRDFCEDNEISTCISYHSYGNLILYPWGYIPAVTPDDAIFETLADSMASYNTYTYGPAATAIYITNGDSDDWMYGEQTTKSKMFSYTFEVGSVFQPATTQIIPICQQNLQPALVLADFTGDLTRVLLPETPTMEPLSDDNDGVYTVEWIDNSDLDNPAVAYALVERTGPATVTDNLEGGTAKWLAESFSLKTTRYHSSTQSYYGGKTNNRNAKLTARLGLGVTASDTLRFWCWYDIESNWDYAYVEVSTDGGEHYYSIPGNITTNYDPNGQNAGNGITGSSSSAWVQGIFPLGAYADSTVHIRFRYWTDGATLGDGFYVDDISHMQTFTASATLSDAITETHYDLTRPIGTYYYEVKAKDDDGQWSYLSQRKHLTVTGAGVPDRAAAASGLVFANPVRVGGKAAFSAPAAKGQSLSVFDVTGRLVAAVRVPASGQATWNLVDEDGRAVSAGIYFVGAGEGTSAARAKLVVLN